MTVEQKYTKQVNFIIQQYFKSSKNIEALAKSPNPKKDLYELTYKLATKFCLANGITSTDSVNEEVLNSFVIE